MAVREVKNMEDFTLKMDDDEFSGDVDSDNNDTDNTNDDDKKDDGWEE